MTHLATPLILSASLVILLHGQQPQRTDMIRPLPQDLPIQCFRLRETPALVMLNRARQRIGNVHVP